MNDASRISLGYSVFLSIFNAVMAFYFSISVPGFRILGVIASMAGIGMPLLIYGSMRHAESLTQESRRLSVLAGRALMLMQLVSVLLLAFVHSHTAKPFLAMSVFWAAEASAAVRDAVNPSDEPIECSVALRCIFAFLAVAALCSDISEACPLRAAMFGDNSPWQRPAWSMAAWHACALSVMAQIWIMEEPELPIWHNIVKFFREKVPWGCFIVYAVTFAWAFLSVSGVIGAESFSSLAYGIAGDAVLGSYDPCEDLTLLFMTFAGCTSSWMLLWEDAS